jgi:exosortase/archaeosortase family protein
VGLALAGLYGELAGDSVRRRLLWLGLMGLFAIVGNWVRIFLIVIAAYETDMRTYLVTVSHYWFGWAVFVVFFLAFLWLAGLLASRWDRCAAAKRRTEASVPDEPLVRETPRASLGCVLAALGALLVLPCVVYARNLLSPVAAQPVVISWPAAPAGWSGPRRSRR